MTKVVKMNDHEIGPWAVVGDDNKLLEWGFDSQEAAWNWIDRHEVRPLHQTHEQAIKRGSYKVKK